MKKKIQASTQNFTEIIDFVGSTVIMNGGKACLIIEITASNFALLSKKEQDARVYSYAGLLNSLSFPIQILIRNKRIDISSYVKDLDDIIKKTTNQNLAEYIQLYRDFIKEAMTVNVVLSKSFYVIITYSYLEAGTAGAGQLLQNNRQQIEAFAEKAHKSLEIKANTVLSQVRRFAVTAKVLERDDLIKLFYDLYNENNEIESGYGEGGINAPIVRGKEV